MISDALTSIFVRAYLTVKNEEGQTFVEYSLIGLLVAVACVATLGLVTGQITTALTKIENAF